MINVLIGKNLEINKSININTMKIKFLALTIAACAMISGAWAQDAAKKDENKKEGYQFTTVKANPVTRVKNQASTGTCWCFSTISFIESECIRKGLADTTLDLSEMFVVSKAYSDKAVKYVRTDGHINFAQGSDFGDVFEVIDAYGICPNSEMTGLNYGSDRHSHSELSSVLKAYVDAIVRASSKKLSTAWHRGFEAVEAAYLGEIPTSFTVDGKKYTPKEYAAKLDIKGEDYVGLTSFTHHPFYTWFAMEVADNWRNTPSYNLPIDEFMQVMEDAVMNGYTIAWGSDVSETGFTRNGIAVVADVKANEAGSDEARWVGVDPKAKAAALNNLDAPGPELNVTQEMRQEGLDRKETTDDHGMHIYGIAKDQNGTKYFMVKNSWGTSSKYKGTWYASFPFVKYKTMNIVVPKAALSKELRKKMGIN